MLDTTTKRRIDDARDILVGKIPDPKSQVEQITIALIYKFMDDMDSESEELGGKTKFFSGEYQKYSWRRIFNQARGGQEILLDYREALQQLSENPNLPNIFHTIFRQAYLPYNDPETLKSFLKIIDQFEYDHSERLGDAFEYLLSVLGSQGDAGQFRTPRHIIDFMVDIVEPKKGETILDPACGTAGFLISAYKYILLHSSSEGKHNGDLLTPDERRLLSQNITGYDISPDMVRLSLVNMYLHRITEPKITEYDTLTSEAKWNEYFDVILANPPFMSPKGGIKPHSRFSIQSKRSEALFVDYIAEHLTLTGRAAVIVPEGVIFKGDSAFVKLRKMLIEENYLYGVISLPSGIFNPYSGVKTSILLLDKVIAKLTDKILFAKVENDGFALGAQRRPIEGSELNQVSSMIRDFKTRLHRNEEFKSDICTLVEKSKLAESGDYNLNGERYRIPSATKNARYVSIGTICDIYNGSTPLKSKDEYWNNGTINWFTINDIRRQGHIIYNTEQKITELALKETSVKLLPIDTVLLCCTASVGECAILKTQSTSNQQFNGLIIKDQYQDDIIPDYLFIIASSLKEELIRLSGKTSFNFVSVKTLKTINIPLPTLKEQQAIVIEIESYQRIIDAARTIVENYHPQITINPEWPTVELEKVVNQSLIGLIRSKAEQNECNEFLYLKMDAIDNKGNLDLDKSVRVNATDEEAQKYALKDGDYLYNTRNAPNLVGKSAVFKDKTDKIYLFNNNLLRIRFKKDLANPIYINIIMNSDYGKQQLNKYIDGTTSVAAIYQKNYFDIKIPLPAIDIQKHIVEEIEQEQEAVDKAKELINIFEKKITNRIAQIWEI